MLTTNLIFHLHQRQQLFHTTNIAADSTASKATRQISTSIMKAASAVVPFMVHSTFRDEQGNQLLPCGLEWDLLGDSHISYVRAPLSPLAENEQSGAIQQQGDEQDNENQDLSLDDHSIRRGIVEAHNKWCFAKDLPFVGVDDILEVSSHGQHIRVRWADLPATRRKIKETRHESIDGLVDKDEAAQLDGAPAEVWINGNFVSRLDGSGSVPVIKDSIAKIRSVKVSFKRSEGVIRIERYFRGMIRGEQVFDHVMDNLYALEDAEILDERTMIGTATLPDWIMGGNLTSRLWVRERQNGNILFLRPLRNDNTDTSDRRYELVKGEDDRKIKLVLKELARLRHVALLPSPFDAKHESGKSAQSPNLQRPLIKKRRKVFGL